MLPTISVIIPAYNAESFLEEALEAVYAQTFTDWELILVDDGSTDSTGAICDRAAARDARVKVVHKANGGLSDARNAGLDRAGGRYVYFMDADDLIPPHALQTLADTAAETGADLVLAPFETFADAAPLSAGTHGPCVRNQALTILSGAEAAEAGMYQRLIDNGACGKLYARAFWESPHIRFSGGILYEDLDDIVLATRAEHHANDLPWRNRCKVVYAEVDEKGRIIYEDLDIFYRVWPRAAKAVLLSEALYFYRQHAESIIHTFGPRRLDALDVTDRMVSWVAENLPSLLPAARDRRMSAHFNILLLMYKHGLDDPEAEARCVRVIRELAPVSLKNSRVRLKNRLGALAYLIGRRPALRAMSLFI